MAEPLTLSRDEFESALTGVEPRTPIQPRFNTRDLIRSKLQRPDVDLDMDTGAPFMDRLHVSFAPDDETRQALLKQSLGGSKVEALRGVSGLPTQFVIRDYVDPTTGKVKDLVVDESAATLKDFADLGETGFEMLGAIAALASGAGVAALAGTGIKRLVAESALAAAGSQLVGAATDAGARFEAGQPIQPGEILARRTAEGALGIGLDLGIGIPVLGASRLRGVGLEPRQFPPLTQEAKRAADAAKRLETATGVNVPTSFAQRTGLPGARQLEAYLQNATIGGGGPLRKLGVRTSKALAASEEAIVGATTPLPNKETLGGQAIRAIRDEGRLLEGASTAARQDALDEAVGLLHGAIDAETGVNRAVLTGESGNAVRQFVKLKHDAFRETSDTLNQEVIAATGTDAFIPTSIARDKVAPVLKRLTRPESNELFSSVPATVRNFLTDIQALPKKRPAVTGQKTSAILDSSGKPITEPVELLPASKGTITITELRDLRSAVNDAISESEILGTRETRHLRQISHALTETLEEGVEHAPDATAKEALTRFNKFYRENIPSLQTKGITEILADPTQRKLGKFAIFDQAAANPDQYFRLKEALTKPLTLDGASVGPDGTETWNLFKKAMLDEAVDSSKLGISSDLVDGRKLLTKLAGLKQEVRQDLLGGGADDISTAAKRLSQLQNPKLNAAEALLALQRGGDKGTANLLALARREEAVDKHYQNQIVKRFAKGEVGSESIHASEFVDRYVSTASNKEELATVMGLLDASDPVLAEHVRQKTVENLFQSARSDPLASAANAKKLAVEIASPETQARLKVVLGEPKTEQLNDFLIVLESTVGKAKEASSQAAGGLKGGTARAQLITGNLAKLLPHQVVFWFVGAAMANPKLYLPVFRGTGYPSMALRTLISTDEFASSLFEEFGPDSGTVMQMFEGAAQQERLGPGETGLMPRDEFERGLR